EIKRPNKVRTEITLEQGAFIQAFDGSVGWQQSPMGGDTAAAKVSDAQARDLADSADLDGPLVDTKAKGYRAKLGGKSEVDDQLAYQVEVQPAPGIKRTFFYSAKTYLKVGWLGTLSGGGQKKDFASEFDDYRDVDGLKRHFHVRTGSPGSSEAQEIK